MDGARFDDLIRSLSNGTSRRRVLQGLLGGAAGGALSLVGLRRAGASHGRPDGATCIRNEHCASGFCDPATQRCTCPGGTPACGGVCCPAGQACVEVARVSVCQEPSCIPSGETCTSASDCCNNNFCCYNTGTGTYCC